MRAGEESAGDFMNTGYYDAHSHLPLMKTEALSGVVINGTREEDWAAVEEAGKNEEGVVASFGFHPWYAGNRRAGGLARLEEILLRNPDAQVGEAGLDAWMLREESKGDARLRGYRRMPMEEQGALLEGQWEIAWRLERTVSLHCVQAWGELKKVIKTSAQLKRGFLLHDFRDSAETVGEWMEMGAYFSFNARQDIQGRKVISRWQAIPLGRILVESDGTSDLREGYEMLAKLRGISLDELKRVVSGNFQRLFLRDR